MYTLGAPTILSTIGKYCSNKLSKNGTGTNIETRDTYDTQLNFTDLFKFIVDEKISIYFKKKGDNLTNTFVRFDNIILKENILKLHTNIALSRLKFNESFSSYTHSDFNEQFLYSIGIFNHSEEKPIIPKPFGEYFIAMELAFIFMKGSDEKKSKFIADNILTKNGKFNSIRIFMEHKFKLFETSHEAQ